MFDLKKLVEQAASGDLTVDEVISAGLEAQRIEFIRRAAIALSAAVVPSDPGVHGAGPIYRADECWGIAKSLWDAKPEDC